MAKLLQVSPLGETPVYFCFTTLADLCANGAEDVTGVLPSPGSLAYDIAFNASGDVAVFNGEGWSLDGTVVPSGGGIVFINNETITPQDEGGLYWTEIMTLPWLSNVTIIFNGVEYNTPIYEDGDGNNNYGAPWSDDSYDWSEYPFNIMLTSGALSSMSLQSGDPFTLTVMSGPVTMEELYHGEVVIGDGGEGTIEGKQLIEGENYRAIYDGKTMYSIVSEGGTINFIDETTGETEIECHNTEADIVVSLAVGGGTTITIQLDHIIEE